MGFHWIRMFKKGLIISLCRIMRLMLVHCEANPPPRAAAAAAAGSQWVCTAP